MKPASQSFCTPFMKGEAGSITTFSVIAVVAMIGIGGLAVDAMYFEGKRVATQDAMDRCSLMATLAQNRLDGSSTDSVGGDESPKVDAIARDCMAKSMVGTAGLNTPAIAFGNSERSVTLSGNYTFNALFPNVGNAASQSYSLTSQAKHKLPNLEISIAIDTTHSTFWTAMRDPLKVMLNTIAAPDTGNKVSVNIIPYGENVFLGTDLIEEFNDVSKPPFSNTDNRACLNLSQTERGELGITFEDPYIWSWPVSLEGANNVTIFETEETVSLTFDATAEATRVMNGSGNCRRQTDPAFVTGNIPLLGEQVQRPVTTGSSDINDALDDIKTTAYAAGSYVDTTGGLKWALAALDDSLNTVFTAVAPGAANRPLAYNAADSMKVLIFITNSAFNSFNSNPSQQTGGAQGREIRPEFLGDTPSTIWRTPSVATPSQPIRLSVYHENAPDPLRPYWVTTGLSGGAQPPSEAAQWMAAPFQHPGGPAPVRLTWREVMSQVSLVTLIRQLHMAPFSPVTNTTNTWSALVEKFTYVVRDNVKDRENFAALCAAAKQRGVLIYMLRGPGSGTASSLAVPIYNACATSNAHVFQVTPTTIKTTLRMIASNIVQLTLVK